jgi:hypothetical protein
MTATSCSLERPSTPSRVEALENAASLAIDIPVAFSAELRREGLVHPAAPIPA